MIHALTPIAASSAVPADPLVAVGDETVFDALVDLDAAVEVEPRISTDLLPVPDPAWQPVGQIVAILARQVEGAFAAEVSAPEADWVEGQKQADIGAGAGGTGRPLPVLAGAGPIKGAAGGRVEIDPLDTPVKDHQDAADPLSAGLPLAGSGEAKQVPDAVEQSGRAVADDTDRRSVSVADPPRDRLVASHKPDHRMAERSKDRATVAVAQVPLPVDTTVLAPAAPKVVGGVQDDVPHFFGGDVQKPVGLSAARSVDRGRAGQEKVDRPTTQGVQNVPSGDARPREVLQVQPAAEWADGMDEVPVQAAQSGERPVLPMQQSLGAPKVQVAITTVPTGAKDGEMPEQGADPDAPDLDGTAAPSPRPAATAQGDYGQVALPFPESDERTDVPRPVAEAEPMTRADIRPIGPRHTGVWHAQTLQAVMPVLVQTAQAAPEGPVALTLSPEELGSVRFEMQGRGEAIHIALTVERPETLDLLRRHVDTLVAEFKQAGFTGTSFSFSGTWGGGQDRGAQNPYRQRHDTEDEPTEHAGRTRGRGGLDLRF